MYSVSFQQLIQNWTEGFSSNTDEEKAFNVSPQFFSYSEEQNNEDALGLFHYVFEEALGWSPYDVQNYSSKETIETLGLKSAYRALMWPYTYDANGNKVPLIDGRSGYGYLAALLYPETIHTLDKEQLWIMSYNAVLSGKKQRSFRVDDFLGNDGYDHARLLLSHYLINNPNEKFTCMDDLYKIFANKKEADKLLKKAKLNIVCKALFASPLDYLHASFPDDGTEAGCSHFSYDFYRFETLLKDVDDVKEHQKEIINRNRKSGESVHTIAKSLDLNEELVQSIINQRENDLAEYFKKKIVTLYTKHMSTTEIARKANLPTDLIDRKLKEWGVIL